MSSKLFQPFFNLTASKKKRVIRLLWSVAIFFFISLCAHFIANDGPYNIIPYSSTHVDINNMDYKSPFDHQNVATIHHRHWFGTDAVGRDVSAGLLSGSRKALVIGLSSAILATIIGSLVGLFAGFFGNGSFWISRKFFWITLPFGLFYFYQVAILIQTFSTKTHFYSYFLIYSFVFATLIGLILYLCKRFCPLQYSKKFAIPVREWIMRLIDIFQSIPLIIQLFALLPFIGQPSTLKIICLIGFLSWTIIAQITEREMLKVKKMEYFNAAKAMGFSALRIAYRHSFPNLIVPIFVSFTYIAANSIMIEALLSFLGMGFSTNTVTWGSMMHEAKTNPSAWWLAVFPGMCIFYTVLQLNKIGDLLSRE
jgi:peptide/nickel transport system permease protein